MLTIVFTALISAIVILAAIANYQYRRGYADGIARMLAVVSSVVLTPEQTSHLDRAIRRIEKK
jgi:hypothetical protein